MGESASTADIAGWAGLLIPYNQPTVDGRVIRRPHNGPRVRDLPIELKYQEAATGAHDGAIVGLASITRTWEDERGLWGSGEFDLADPDAAALARKIRDGFAGHVSVDLGDFAVARQQLPGGDVVEAVTDWKLLSTTIVADAALDGARIYTVTDPEQITPTAEVLAARRTSDGVFSTDPERSCRLTFATGPTDDEPDPGLTITVTRATGLPWAPKNTRWNASDARRRVAAACRSDGNTAAIDPDCYGRAFIYREAGADPTRTDAYKLPFADIIDGRLTAVLGGVRAAAQRLTGAGITSADTNAARTALRDLYTEAATALDDDSITAPFHGETLAMADNTTPDNDTDVPNEPEAADRNTEALDALTGNLERLLERMSELLDRLTDTGQATATPEPAEPTPVMPHTTDTATAAAAAAIRLARAVSNRRTRLETTP